MKKEPTPKAITVRKIDLQSSVEELYKRVIELESFLFEVGAVLLEAKVTIHGWHDINDRSPEADKVWRIYNARSPEMVRLNSMIAKVDYQLTKRTAQ